MIISGRNATIEIGIKQPDGSIAWEDITARYSAATNLPPTAAEERMRAAAGTYPTGYALGQLRDAAIASAMAVDELAAAMGRWADATATLGSIGVVTVMCGLQTPRHASPRRAARRAHRRRLKRGH